MFSICYFLYKHLAYFLFCFYFSDLLMSFESTSGSSHSVAKPFFLLTLRQRVPEALSLQKSLQALISKWRTKFRIESGLNKIGLWERSYLIVCVCFIMYLLHVGTLQGLLQAKHQEIWHWDSKWALTTTTSDSTATISFIAQLGFGNLNAIKKFGWLVMNLFAMCWTGLF